MALSQSPRKTIPLATGDEDRPPLRSRTSPALTRRAFYCGVVVENAGHGRELPQEVQELVASLGEPIDLDSDASSIPSASDSNTDIPQPGDEPHMRKRALTNTSALANVINEFVQTERTYVKRLRTLKHDYADPLRTFSRSKDTAIIPPYEAKTLFGNIDSLVPVNEAFLEDLEKMIAPDGPQTVGGIGDVVLKHFKQLRGFENYKQYYSKREEAQAIYEKEKRKASQFAAFIDRIKYSSADVKNRVGLGELLMEPVQRIPRYTLMFQTMLKHMAPSDPQRAKLVEADEIASKIAQAETDEQTKRATIMYCLSATIEDFPADLMSNSRQFIDCIDVEDILADSYANPSMAANGPLGNLHCSLFLFHDKMMIVKRPGNGEKSARTLSGLSDLDKIAKSGGLPLGLKKSGMVCKGVIDITDIVATDVGGADMHIYMECPPIDQSERWNGRPFRALSVVFPPYTTNLDPPRSEGAKKRFLDNLWVAQARYRTRLGQSVTLYAEEREVESRGGKVTFAKTYFNVYQRTAFLKEAKKTKVVLHVDPTGAADPIPFGIRGPPLVVVRVQPMAGELSRYTVTSVDPNDEDEEDIVQTARIPERIVHTIHQYGLFKFKTGNVSMPATPTASMRTKAAIFGLDAISRNLFGAFPGASKSDIFGGSVNSHKRSKTTTSRSSIYTQSTSTNDSSLTRFSRTNSTATSATSVMDDEYMSVGGSSGSGSTNGKTRSRSLSRAKKLIKRAKSPGYVSEPENPVPSPGRGAPRMSHSVSEPGHGRPSSRASGYSEYEDEGASKFGHAAMDESERDLVARLELARRNSQNQHETKYVPAIMDHPPEETIYEDDPPIPIRPTSRMSRDLPDIPTDAQSYRSTTPRPDSAASDVEDHRRSRSIHRVSPERRPHGPRTPSPLPPLTPTHSGRPEQQTAMDVDLALEETLVNVADTPVTPRRSAREGVSPIPRSKRQPFVPMINTDTTPKVSIMTPTEVTRPLSTVEPLSIQKKTSVRTMDGSPARRERPSHGAMARSSPIKRPESRSTPVAREGSLSQSKNVHIPISSKYAVRIEQGEQLVRLAETTKEDLESARRAVKRIKLETSTLSREGSAPSSPAANFERSGSPVKGLRTPQRTVPPPQPMTREAQARMEEMRQLISKRNGETTPRTRPLSMVSDGSLSRISDLARNDECIRTIEELASQAEQDLSNSLRGHEQVQFGLRQLTEHLQESASELEKTRLELEGAKRQCEVVKSLLTDVTDEKEILYTAFNEELDGMYEAANNLPPDDAWAVMTKDLRETKEARNTLARENSQLKRKLAELELQNEEWGRILRTYGLIS
ncbi:hypothetical protein K474DRAFT_1655326 [Panus rudis PR-1116 ss-1]|nr:hypothetical protein K474DRAFT_1655326 [Panus rudis PR-1116 ss-1]